MSKFGSKARPLLLSGWVAVTLAFGLVACSGDKPVAKRVLTAEEQAVQDQMKARSANFSDLGAAFKAVNDEIKAGHPTSTTAQFQIKSVARYGAQVRSWFPAGTGPETGFKTEAKAEIWTDAAGFDEQLAAFEAATAELGGAGNTGDPDAITAAFRKVGGTCKSCHDKYRDEH